MKVLVNLDIVSGIIRGNSIGVELSDKLAQVGIKNLRYDGKNIVKATDYNVFYIDADGIKHIFKHNSTWQKLTCQFDDPLILNTGKWRKQSPKDIENNLLARITAQINGYAKNLIDNFAGDYSKHEVATWERLDKQCRDYRANGKVGGLMILNTHSGRNNDQLTQEVIGRSELLDNYIGLVSIQRDKHIMSLISSIDPLKYDWLTGWPK